MTTQPEPRSVTEAPRAADGLLHSMTNMDQRTPIGDLMVAVNQALDEIESALAATPDPAPADTYVPCDKPDHPARPHLHQLMMRQKAVAPAVVPDEMGWLVDRLVSTGQWSESDARKDLADFAAAIRAEGRGALDVERERDRLLTAVEAAILNIQHNRFSAAAAGLRAARDLSLAQREPAESQGPDGGRE